MELGIHIGIQFVDLDLEIEKAEKQSIWSVFEEKGEAYFRQQEKVHLQKIINELPEFVLATGGGTPSFFNNMDIMNGAGTTVFINTPIEKIKKRIQQDTVRPLMNSNTVEYLYEQRRLYYEKAQKKVQSLRELLSLFDPKN